MAFIELENISKIYHMGEVEIAALKDTSFTIEKGELVCILGPSGAGKTTCLNILGGMDSLTDGRVVLDGEDISHYNANQKRIYGFMAEYLLNVYAEARMKRIIYKPCSFDCNRGRT